ncbi:FAD:protein FMN transferase [Demequina sp. TTPB684]|uniref:FAD:protein FMN transferase n=1 Tax=unclassified Demequina TaxID=2620311 RepID=UPI001CF393B3|nr:MULTISPECIES: FAD:protein FMN transferase [unclassified Demequina]MCB2413169.1 FAD:protein FMN transferase [Demequina sp. TTPB684]UPU89675.1 FAD:protein FMN transferase [Demequina sp. TMPB413]
MTVVPPFSSTVTAMGMPFVVQLEMPPSDAVASYAVERFHHELLWADEVFSLFKDDSYLSRLNRGEISIDDCPPEMFEILNACEWYRSKTLGGFDARRPDHLDPSGIVKGWAVARGSTALDAISTAAWMIGASGDVLVSGEGREWRIGIADPRVSGDPNGSPVVDVVMLGGELRALATSGSAQKGLHIWDPSTGEGAQHYLQVSVMAGTMMDADAWATAIAAGGERVLSAALDAGVEAMAITNVRDDGTYGAYASSGWPSVLAA